MAVIHYLNVCEGDCSAIEHNSGHITVIDVCNAKASTKSVLAMEDLQERLAKAAGGNFQQKKHPVNPISYLQRHGIESVFRFVATHPDMDHLDGLKAFFSAFSPLNLWDTDNTAEKDFSGETRYSEEDWKFYKQLRDGKPRSSPKRLTIYSGKNGEYWNKNGENAGDGLHVLAPTPSLVKDANKCGDWNDCSYVLLYRPGNYRVVFGGDSNDKAWEHILEKHKKKVTDIDLLIAPHHGRKSDRCYDFLDVLRPKLTFFGNANCEHLAYGAWNNRDLPFITNNQAGCMVVETGADGMGVYVTNEKFARAANEHTFYEERLQAWYYGPIL
jgi:competence protein ComEC